VPQFNPLRLYANTTPVDENEPPEDSQQNAPLKILDLLGGTLPSEDGQELDAPRCPSWCCAPWPAATSRSCCAGRCRRWLGTPVARRIAGERSSRTVRRSSRPYLVLQKDLIEDDSDDVDGREVRIRPQKGETLPRSWRGWAPRPGRRGR
jgi:hypothetical protein